jgi:hypothetical protein
MLLRGLSICFLALGIASSLIAAAKLTRAEAARELCQKLDIPETGGPVNLYGLYPGIFPGGYDGQSDLTYSNLDATLETIVVALVRWAGWDVIHYDERLIEKVKPFVTPEGFPFYKPDPTPRSIPYVVVAIQRGVMAESDLPNLRAAVTREQIARLVARTKASKSDAHISKAIVMDDNGTKSRGAALKNPRDLVVLPTGFTKYSLVGKLPNRILDLNAPGLRIFNQGSSYSNGKQNYFPLGALDSLFTIALHVPLNSFAHQSEAVEGVVENESSTVNAVGVWGRGISLQKGARVWAGFFDVGTGFGPDKDAQLVGLEVDVTNRTLPGVAPNRSKTGIQVVGFGDASVTNAIEIIGSGLGRWSNGLLFAPQSVELHGAIIGAAGPATYDRGIDFGNVKFSSFALSLSQGSTISFLNKGRAGNSLIYTDDFDNGHLVMRAGASGLRITSNNDSKNLMAIDQDGQISTPIGTVGVRVSVPPISTAPCKTGNWAADNEYFYICLSENKWRRAGLSSW